MRKGISVWLDVPLDALARRIVAVGTGSRPLLHHGDGDPYAKVGYHFCRLYRVSSRKGWWVKLKPFTIHSRFV